MNFHLLESSAAQMSFPFSAASSSSALNNSCRILLLFRLRICMHEAYSCCPDATVYWFFFCLSIFVHNSLEYAKIIGAQIALQFDACCTALGQVERSHSASATQHIQGVKNSVPRAIKEQRRCQVD